MMELRDYQIEAREALYDWFRKDRGHPLVVAPTGSGKSVMIADFIKSALSQFPETRVLCVTHVKELIAQNHRALLRLWPEAPSGIYSAGLGKKQGRARVVFAGIQSFARRAADFGAFDLIIVDEAHLIPRSADTQYGRLFEVMHDLNPHAKVIGYTATPYRLDSGALTGGNRALFDGIAYDIPITLLVERGYLAPLVSKKPGTLIDTTGLHKRMGEFVGKELDERVRADGLTEAAVSEIVSLGQDRRAWLAFCVSVEHAHEVCGEIKRQGFTAGVVTGETPPHDRARLISEFQSNRIRALCSVGVLTTGFDAPITDLIAMLRPTASTGLYVQICGRGMRTAPDKADCLVLDFAGNVMRHGPVDCIPMPGVKGAAARVEGEVGTMPAKECPMCQEIVSIGTMECSCGYQWPEPEPKHDATATDEAVMQMTAPKERWRQVQDIDYARHRKTGSPDSLRVDYLIDGRVVRHWVCFEHTGRARQQAVGWWQAHAGMSSQPPDTTDDALKRIGEVSRAHQAIIARDGGYWRIERLSFDHPEENAA